MAPARGVPSLLLRASVFISLAVLIWLLSERYSGRSFPVSGISHRPAARFHGFGGSVMRKPARGFAFPAQLWQKTSSMSFSASIERDLQTWRRLNPSFDFKILDDDQSDTFVRTMFADHPGIVNLYTSLRIPIVKADLFRYLVLYAEGGIWSDLDVACEKPVAEWLPVEYLAQANLVVGIEGVEEYRGQGVALGSQFASWVVMAKPGSEHLLYVVNSIRERFESIAEKHNVGIDGIELGMLTDVVDESGPYKMTRGILKLLHEQNGYIIDDRDLAKIKSPTLYGEVLILPGAAFAAEQNKFPTDQGVVLVTHHYQGSWKLEADEARLQKVGLGKV